MVKTLPAMKTWVQSLGWEDPLEKGALQLLSVSARARELKLLSPQPQLLKPKLQRRAPREATTRRNLSTATGEQPPFTATREKPS